MNGQDLVVYGAGCRDVNGIYQRDGEYNHQPMYTCADSGLQVWFNGEWRLGRTNDYYYTNREEHMLDGTWVVATSRANAAACSPGPDLRWDNEECQVRPQVKSPQASSKDIAADQPNVLGWIVDRVHVFIVGFNRFKGDAAATWSDADRVDRPLAEHFLALGVPPSQVVLLCDDEGTVTRARTAFRQLCRAASPGDLLVFYWGSHGTLPRGAKSEQWYTSSFDGYFYGTEFMQTIHKHFAGSHCFITVDSCYSGSMVEIAESYAGNECNVFALSSTARGQSAWSKWRFARCLLRGFRGEASSADGGPITLSDLAKYTQSEIAFFADGHPEFVDVGFDAGRRLVSTVSVAKTLDSMVGDRVLTKGGPAVITEDLGEGQVSVEYCSSQRNYVIDSGSTRPFKWRKFETSQAVQFKWWHWSNWIDAFVVDTFEHLYLLAFDAHKEHPDAGMIWAPAACIRLAGEDGIGLKVIGAGCGIVDGTYQVDGEYNARPMYTCAASGFQIWYNGQWRLGRTNDYYYVCNSENVLAGSWKVATFQANPETTEPVPAVQPTSVTVTNAGCGLVNGIYELAGEYGERPMYECTSSKFQLWYNGQWRLGRTNDYYYVCNGEALCGSWKVATFQANPETTEPPPRVEANLI